MGATVAAIVLLVLATAACLAWLVPTLAGLLPQRKRTPSTPRHTFVILIPAHNEETTLPTTLRSLGKLDYPTEMFQVWVVADNCTDGTIHVAQSFGVRCLVRNEPEQRGKGYALAFGLERVIASSPDIVLILDADCDLNPAALRALDEAFAAEVDAVQCSVNSRNADAGVIGYVAAVGAAMDETLAAGRDRLGLSVALRGTGMAFRTSVFKRLPWTAFGLVEDAEYAKQLRHAGVRVRHCVEAVVSSDAPACLSDLYQQRRRWRAAGVLASKPLNLALIAVAAGVGFLGRFVWWPAALLILTAAIFARAAATIGFSRRHLGFLLKSPFVVLWLSCVAVGGMIHRKPTAWNRTPRSAENERRAA